MRSKFGKSNRVCSQDGRKQRKTKEEIQKEMLRLKEGLEAEEEKSEIFQRQEFVREIKEQILRRPTQEELELEKLEHEERRKKLLEFVRPKSK